ncbi:AAA-type ATPase family protein [Striga hermonthica]|uniref:AAA-type ATPase family protein n=1 Tax=Striga hermonthica TaxID=68872 RepID=A0A9N7R7C7_STRHE|nr:AAA-type ATPase family protein [Striga hermonthica]
METEKIEQLVNMGFPANLAAESLAAAAGDLIKATDWLLNHDNGRPPPPETPSSSSSPQAVQPKINRFFNIHPKKDHNPPPLTHHRAAPAEEEDCQSPPPPPHPNKRPKFAQKGDEKIAQKPPARAAHAPLSERMRPRDLDEVVGQDHLLSPGSLLRSAISAGRLPSIVLWGPPGTGKTSIARAIAASCGPSLLHRFVSLSAVTAGVKDVRDAVDEARKTKQSAGKRTVLFLDEVHRFNKAQQDSFLPVIEDGSIIFIGATTENPSFHLITPLLSRCRVLTLNPLKPQHLKTLINRAIHDLSRGLPVSLKTPVKFEINADSSEFLSSQSDGDARVVLNALEIAAISASENPQKLNPDSPAVITLDHVKEALQCKHLNYDRAGEEHYNLISALHKSMRGSDPDASIYWLTRMLEGGEQPLYIARRLVRFASEDVGLADPMALTQAVSCYHACHFIGMPECNVVLGQCVAYLALAPKSIAVYRAMQLAGRAVSESVGQNEPDLTKY